MTLLDYSSTNEVRDKFVAFVLILNYDKEIMEKDKVIVEIDKVSQPALVTKTEGGIDGQGEKGHISFDLLSHPMFVPKKSLVTFRFGRTYGIGVVE